VQVAAEDVLADTCDEYDLADVEQHYADRGADIDGLNTLHELTDQTGYVLPSGPHSTVVGFFMAQLNAVPSLGDRIVVDVDSRLSITQLHLNLHAGSQCRACLSRTSASRRSLANRL
jgi:CBS domain containing-hemolysin-like protein